MPREPARVPSTSVSWDIFQGRQRGIAVIAGKVERDTSKEAFGNPVQIPGPARRRTGTVRHIMRRRNRGAARRGLDEAR